MTSYWVHTLCTTSGHALHHCRCGVAPLCFLLSDKSGDFSSVWYLVAGLQIAVFLMLGQHFLGFPHSPSVFLQLNPCFSQRHPLGILFSLGFKLFMQGHSVCQDGFATVLFFCGINCCCWEMFSARLKGHFGMNSASSLWLLSRCSCKLISPFQTNTSVAFLVSTELCSFPADCV